MDGRTAVVAIVIGLGGLGGLGAVAGLGGCVMPRDMVEAVDQVTAHPGTFHHSQQLTADLFGLEAAGFERFEVYFLGSPDDPDIVVLDPLDDGYRFDARGWQSAQGGKAVEVVANTLARTESAEALLGQDAIGRVVTLGIVVKERQKTSYKAGQRLYTISYNRFGLYRVGQGEFHEKPATVDAEGSAEDG